MKTTIELPDSTFARAKNLADSKGISIKQLFVEAIQDKVKQGIGGKPQETPWGNLAGAFGKTQAARAETRRIQNLIDEEFERIDAEDR